MDVAVVNKRFVAGLVLLVLAFWYFPVGLLVDVGLLVVYRRLKRRNDKAGPLPTATTAATAGFDPQATIAALVSGVPERQTPQPRQYPSTTRPKKAPAQDFFA